MTVYQDTSTGKCFVHINELREKAMKQVNEKSQSPERP